MWIALILEEFLEEVVRLGCGANIFLLFVKFGHQECGVVDPLVPSTETLVTELNDRVCGELGRFKKNTKLGVFIFHFTAENGLDVFTVIVADGLGRNDAWCINEPHILDVVCTIHQGNRLGTEAIFITKSHGVRIDSLEDFVDRQILPVE